MTVDLATQLAPFAASFVDEVTTPAFVYSESAIRDALLGLHRAIGETGCKLLFTLKPFSRAAALRFMRSHVDGFSASSPFEAALARACLGDRGTVHITTPGLRAADIDAVADACDFIAFNSLSQWDSFRDRVGDRSSCGLRVNPQFSVLRDQRYDPCRLHSKLGVPLDVLVDALARRDPRLDAVRGIHFHTNCDSTDFAPLHDTALHIERTLAALLERAEWVNLGGGYLAEGATNVAAFRYAAARLRRRGLDVFIEPGAAAVRSAGQLVATVIDLFDSNGMAVAVLDTTVNHYPEAFEYQWQPDVEGHQPGNRYTNLLAGSSCLAGDLFGTYCFARKLEIGSRVVFPNAGAYTLVKAHMFNGINLPNVYCVRERGDLVLEQRFTYDDYLRQNGANNHAAS